jgi:hypothetical protein
MVEALEKEPVLLDWHANPVIGGILVIVFFCHNAYWFIVIRFEVSNITCRQTTSRSIRVIAPR